jgi:hypothetical protein
VHHLPYAQGICHEFQRGVSELRRDTSRAGQADSRAELARVEQVERVDGRTHAASVNISPGGRNSDATCDWFGQLTDELVPNS